MIILEKITRISNGLSSRARNILYRLLGLNLKGYCLLKNIDIPRQWSDVTLAENVALDNGVSLICSSEPRSNKIFIGSRTYINRYTIIDASESIHIDEDCMIGPHSYITDHDHLRQEGVPISQLGLDSSPTSIGKRVWIGAHVVILKGVSIGDDAIIAAGAVVTKSVPAGQTVGGIPATSLKKKS